MVLASAKPIASINGMNVPGDSSRDLFIPYLEVTNSPLKGSLNHAKRVTSRIARYLQLSHKSTIHVDKYAIIPWMVWERDFPKIYRYHNFRWERAHLSTPRGKNFRYEWRMGSQDLFQYLGSPPFISHGKAFPQPQELGTKTITMVIHPTYPSVMGLSNPSRKFPKDWPRLRHALKLTARL